LEGRNVEPLGPQTFDVQRDGLANAGLDLIARDAGADAL
jgi:hypothetical protein